MKKLALIYRGYAPLAREYSKFLNRWLLETLDVIIGKNKKGLVVDVYAYEDEHLALSYNSPPFDEEEKQIALFLETIDKLVDRLFLAEEEIRELEKYDDEYEDDEEEPEYEDIQNDDDI